MRAMHYGILTCQALTKFLKSVTWTDAGEARQAVQILPRWSEIDVGDALELLGAKFDNTSVRAYAVDRLRKADDEVCHDITVAVDIPIDTK